MKRNGETVANIDLYDFLIRGNKARDVKLMPEDVIFIPPIGSLVGIAGNVERPAIYEMKGRIRLSEAIKLAGESRRTHICTGCRWKGCTREKARCSWTWTCKK